MDYVEKIIQLSNRYKRFGFDSISGKLNLFGGDLKVGFNVKIWNWVRFKNLINLIKYEDKLELNLSWGIDLLGDILVK